VRCPRRRKSGANASNDQESCRIWLKRNLVTMDWLERIRIGQLAFESLAAI
jgi:hypothetical protein